ncbi:MAG TPA: outer membrane beta-barrel protein [Steroidobacteraceae bacterium]
MSLRNTLFAALGLLCLIPAARAQYYYTPASPDSRPVSVYVMGGFNEPTGQTSNILQGGWDIGFGVAFRQPGSPLALRLELNYAQNNATNQLLNQGTQESGLQINSGWADLFSFTANAELRFPFGPNSYGYVIAGGGGYYTQVSLTTQGYGYVCDPWWGYCYVGYGDVVVSQNDTTKFGWNAGAGMSFALRSGMTLFVEARYNQIQLPQKFEYVPITVGLKF